MRKQEVKYTTKGRTYLTYYGRRIYLDEVMKMPIETYEGNEYCGYQGYSNSGAYWVGLSDCGDEGWVILR